MKDGTSKTVHMDAYRVVKNKTAEPAKQILHGLKTRLCRHFVDALPRVLDLMDDVLFDLAEKGETNEVQTTYLDTMREIRIRRAGIETDFQRILEDSIGRKCALGTANGRVGNGRQSKGLQDGGLSLVGDSEMEERLAVTNSAEKMRALCAEPLHALNRRVALLLGVGDIECLDNPFDPINVCESFRSACRDATDEIKLKLILLKLFDRFICAGAPELYTDLNRYLVAENILPELRIEIKRHPRALVARGAPEGGGVSADVQPYPPAGILNLLHQFLGSTASAATVVVPASVIAGLTDLQRGGLGDEFDLYANTVDAKGAATNVLHPLRSVELGQGLVANDAMILDIVAMMFDYILGDRNLPDEMKAVIARLQIPILKVAMLDKTFFSRKFHPARRLLNRLAEAAVGWDKGSKGSGEVYDQVVQTVANVQSGFESDVSVFAQVLQSFEAFWEQTADRAGKQAGQAAKQIQRREALAESKSVVAQVVAARLKEDTLPLVYNFIDRYWRAYLVATRARYGQGSPEWKVAVKTLDGLLWSVVKKKDAKERGKMLHILPALRHNLNIGMHRVTMPADEQTKFEEILSFYHARAVEPPSPAAGGQNGPRRSIATRMPTPPSDTKTPCPPTVERGHTMDLDAGIDSQAADSDPSDSGPYQDGRLEAAVRQLCEAVQAANDVVHGIAVSREDCRDMGTTLVAAQFVDDHVVLANVGDSRCYRLRGSDFDQLTTDHSVRQELIEQGFLSQQEAKESQIRNYVTRAVGVDETVEVDSFLLPVLPGDLFLLCSDGLTDLVDDEVIRTALLHDADNPAATVAQLIAMANDNGGPDNISVILAKAERPFPTLAQANVVTCLSGRLSMSAGSDVGRERKVNEDVVATDLANGLALLADGMGGYQSGEVASRLAVDTVRDHCRSGSAAPGQPARSDDGANPLGEVGLNSPDEVRAGKLEKEMLAMIAARPVVDEEIPMDPIAEQMNDVANGMFGGPTQATELDDQDADIGRAVMNLAIGAWVEYQQDGGDPLRARLTWISAVTDVLVFTDRNGHLVTEVSRRTLVEDVVNGRAHLLEDVPLFDRAMGNLMSRLKETA